MDNLMKNCPCSNTTTQYFFHVLNNHINERLTFWAVTLADSEAYLFFLQSNNSCLVSVRIVSFRQEIQISIIIRKMMDVKEPTVTSSKLHLTYWPIPGHAESQPGHNLDIVCCWRWWGGWCWTRSTLASSETTSCCCSPWAWPLVRWHPLPLIGQ